MIPKIIHYCWFGCGKMPDLALKCIESWKKFLPDYELRLWNEETFDVNSVPYVKEAYEARKFAFVTDYIRLWALEREGGVYSWNLIRAAPRLASLTRPTSSSREIRRRM